MVNRARTWWMVVAVTCCAAGSISARIDAQVVTPGFELNYTLHDIGSVPGVPTPYGGLTFKYDDPNTLLIGGQANQVAAAIYAVPVARGCDGIITGFAGPATLYASAPRIDGGLAYGPENVLFFTTYNNNTLGQIKPGSTEPDKIITLGPLGVSASTGTLGFIPQGLPGAGRLKILSYNASRWYDTSILPDGKGTFDIEPVTTNILIGGGPEGVAFVAPGSPQITVPTAIVSEYGQGRVVLYDLDDNGDPVVESRRILVTGLGGAEGATIDPVTNDFLFSTFGGGNRVLVVRGFETPGVAGDLNGDGEVNVTDLLILLSAWGPCPGGKPCEEDLNGDCHINVSDLLILLSNWG